MEDDKLIIHCPTKEDYIKIIDKIGWYSGCKNYENWEDYEEETSLRIKENKIQFYCDLAWYRKEYPDYKVITAKEYLGEPVFSEESIEAALRIPRDYYIGKSRFFGSIEDGYSNLPKENATTFTNGNKQLNNKKKGNKVMSNIKIFFNDLTVSGDDKELRTAGLKDRDLNWTTDAKDIVLDLEAKELGYKDFEAMSDKHCVSQGYSAFEIIDLMAKFSEKLLATAKKFNKKNK